jgi:acetylornithine deacetylase/succinyl-diaminopimelate desuccinylase-like protein
MAAKKRISQSLGPDDLCQCHGFDNPVTDYLCSMKRTLFSWLVIALIAHQSFQCSRLRSHAENLTPMVVQDVNVLANDSLEGRGTGTAGEVKAGNYLVKRMSSLGLTPKGENGTWYQEFTFKPHPPVQMHHTGDSVSMGMALVKEITGRNVLGYLDMGAERTVVIGAHYDHLGYGDENSLWTGERQIHNGADDNASGVSCMLEIARQITLSPSSYKGNNYLFIAFSGEEKGLWGSNYFSKHSTLDTARMNYMINLDMVGRLNAERALAINGTGTSPVWKEVLPNIRSGNMRQVTSEGGIGPSDHTSFYHIGVPALHFFTGQHEDYHKPTDDADRVNYEGINEVSGFITELIRTLNKRGELLFTRTKEEKQATAADFKVTLGVVPDYLFGGPGMRIDGIREGRPAALAGLKQGDILLKIGEYDIVDMMSYMESLGKFEKGQQTQIEIDREGQRQTVTVTWD